ncbi:MAG: Rab family GTPase, partial [Candidatus Thorarchaeota archaeon]
YSNYLFFLPNTREKKFMIISIKSILCGEGAVGKTTIRRRYMGQTLNSRYLPTIGAEISINQFKLQYKNDFYNVKIQIWDLAGQQTFKSVRPLYFNGAQAIFLVYDLTNTDSFIKLDEWITNIATYVKLGRVPIILIGNKADLRKNSKTWVEKDQANDFAKRLTERYTNSKWEVPVLETSAINGENIKEMFEEVAKLVVNINKEEEIH